MIRVYFLVEGQTEDTFVNRVLRPHLRPLGINPHPQRFGKRGHYASVPEYPKARIDILATLKEDWDSYCTTMVDYYAMPGSWPGRETAAGDPDVIERAVLQDVANAMGEDFDSTRFFPYVQMHEFEALLFSCVETLSRRLGLLDENPIRCILNECRSPEQINDNQETAPSKRIIRLCPSYQKVDDGFRTAQEIGLDVMRAQCPHFNEWIARLEALAENNRKVE